MAVTKNGSVYSATGSGAATLDVTASVLSGTNSALVVPIMWARLETISAVTWDVGGVDEDVPILGQATSFNRKAGLAGAVGLTPGVDKILRITFSADPLQTFAAAAINFEGVDQATPFGTFAGSGGNNGAPSVDVTSETGALVIDATCKGINLSAFSADSPQIEQFNTISTNGYGASLDDGAASVTMSWAFTASNDNQRSSAGVSIKPAAVAALVPMMLMGGNMGGASPISGGTIR